MKAISDFVQRCFPAVVKTPSFLQLDFNFVNKILSSSQLRVSTELEVLNAAITWLHREHFDRSEFVKSLVLKTRFPLLSDQILTNFIRKRSFSPESHQTNDECRSVLNEIMQNKKDAYSNKSRAYFTNRCCESSMFDVLICGGRYNEFYRDNLNAYQTRVNDLNKFAVYATTTEKWKIHYAVYLNGEIYCFCHFFDEYDDEINSFQKYSPAVNTWKTLESYPHPHSIGNCVCSFMDSIFVMGDLFNSNTDNDDDDDYVIGRASRSCTAFDATSGKWKKVPKMGHARGTAACAVFGGKVVVSMETA